jgi:hypothetical protein
VSIPESALSKRPSFGLGLLTGYGCLDQFLEAFNWVLSEIKKVETQPDHPEVALPESSDDGIPA